MESPSPRAVRKPLESMETKDENLDVCRENKRLSRELLIAGKYHESPFLVKKQKSKIPPVIFKVPQSSLLKNVQAFLPQMQAANIDLEERLKSEPPSAIDIQHTDDTDGPIIEMDIALLPQDSSDDSDDTSDLDTSSDDDSDNDNTSDNDSDIKLPDHVKKKHMPKIEVLNESCDNDTL